MEAMTSDLQTIHPAKSRLINRIRLGGVLLLSLLLLSLEGSTYAANVRTENFLIQADSPELARQVAEAAERYRYELAVYWLGGSLPPWPRPCPIRVVSGRNLAAQGVTTYNPVPVRDFQMEVVGTPQRILDSVLPHEITHTILATYFGRPLPRWADEGICTTVEHQAERGKHEEKLLEFLQSRRGIAMNQLFLLKEYPSDVLPMYAQGYSVCRFLIDQKGPRAFIKFLEDYLRRPSWTTNVKRHYGYESLQELQDYWIAWVAAGSGSSTQYAKHSQTTSAPDSESSVVQASAVGHPENLGQPHQLKSKTSQLARTGFTGTPVRPPSDNFRPQPKATNPAPGKNRVTSSLVDLSQPSSMPLTKLVPVKKVAAADHSPSGLAMDRITLPSSWDSSLYQRKGIEKKTDFGQFGTPNPLDPTFNRSRLPKRTESASPGRTESASPGQPAIPSVDRKTLRSQAISLKQGNPRSNDEKTNQSGQKANQPQQHPPIKVDLSVTNLGFSPPSVQNVGPYRKNHP